MNICCQAAILLALSLPAFSVAWEFPLGDSARGYLRKLTGTLPSCAISVTAECTEDKTSLDCKEITPKQCNDPPTVLTMRYKGGNCDQTKTKQTGFACIEEFSNAHCPGGVDIQAYAGDEELVVSSPDPSFLVDSYIVLKHPVHGKPIAPTGPVDIRISAKNCEIEDGTQHVSFSAACGEDQPLIVADIYGALQVTGFENKAQGNVSSVVNVTYSHSFNNIGRDTFTILDANVTVPSPRGQVPNYTATLTHMRIQPANSFILDTKAYLDITSEDLIKSEINVTAATETGTSCSSSDEEEVTPLGYVS